MGGFAAIKIALTRPKLFGFVGALSPSIDILHRRFNIRRTGEWWRIRTIFGPSGSETRISRDPFALVKTADPAKTPYIYLTAGENEPLLDPNRRFAGRLKACNSVMNSTPSLAATIGTNGILRFLDASRASSSTSAHRTENLSADPVIPRPSNLSPRWPANCRQPRCCRLWALPSSSDPRYRNSIHRIRPGTSRASSRRAQAIRA